MNPNNNTHQLADKNILITGASGGLGKIAAKACAAGGATVILLDKNLQALEQLYDEIVVSGSPQPALYPIDHAGAKEQDYFELANILDQEFGALDGLLHNASAFTPLEPVDNIETSDWVNVLNVNINTPFILTRVLLPLLRKSEHASVVFTSDSSARRAKAYWGAYGVSKIAIEGFAHILADELESAGRIRVNILIPGRVNSPLRKRAFPAEEPEQLATAQSLEDLYIYLLSGASLGINGQTFIAEEFNQ